jgi:hypothetical protein
MRRFSGSAVALGLALGCAAAAASPPPDRRENGALAQDSTAGIQWFATLKSGLGVALQSGRPILLVAAAPHCAGVPGIW